MTQNLKTKVKTDSVKTDSECEAQIALIGVIQTKLKPKKFICQ